MKYVGTLSPKVEQIYETEYPDVQTKGGPVFIEVGEKVSLSVIEHSESRSNYKHQREDEIEVAYPNSGSLEYYFYRPPIVKKVEPLSGLTEGGTNIELTGAWFDHKP